MDRTTTSLPSRARRRHAALLAGSALGSLLAAFPQAAIAQVANPDQGFQGSHAVNAGGASVFTGGTGSQSTTVDVAAPQTVLTWTPTDPATSGTVDFLPDGYSAAFTSSTLNDYTVLNRILPGGTATIGLNGTITSSVSNGEGQSPGGNVWFYTPNGFVIGPSAVIQVGGLVMTTNDIVFGSANTGGDTLYDANGFVQFRGPANSTGSITVAEGAFISGNNSGSYVAMVGPRIEQHGYVSASRSIGYVAAEQVDMRINAGNFDIAVGDIVVGEGTTDPNGIVHDGTTTGDASFFGGDRKAIQFVAVPKNTALTMLLSGGIGYTPASSAFDDGSSITLLAGGDGTPAGNIAIGTADFRNRVDGRATGDLIVAPNALDAGGEGVARTTFEGFTSLSGDRSVQVTAAAVTEVVASNGLALHSDNAASGGTISVTALAGDAVTPAGLISVTSGLSADVSHTGAVSEDGTTGADGYAGTITIAADGGRIDANYLSLYARGDGGFGTQSGGDGYGGSIDLHAGLGGEINAFYAFLDAQGHGGASYEFTDTDAIGGRGGIGTGGAITLADSSGDSTADPAGGLLNLGSLYLDASAVGGNSLNRASGLGGDAFGGTIDITLDRQNQALSTLSAYARAADGDGGAEDPLGGTITMIVGGGIAVDLDNLYLDTGVEASINSPAGAYGQGGVIDLAVNGEASLVVSGSADLTARADVSASFFDVATTSPDLTGGSISVTADSGTIEMANLSVNVSANNVGAVTSAGIAQGGSATVRAVNGGSIATISPTDCSECFGGNLVINAGATGTGGGAANLVTGGGIALAAESGGTIVAGSGTIDLDASAGYSFAFESQATGVTAQGGTIAIDALGGTIATGITADVSAEGGFADVAAGSGTGGVVDVRVLGGTLVNPLYVDATGSGGFSSSDGSGGEGSGGDGTGGRLTVVSDADATFADFGLTFYANGNGGSAVTGSGGDGFGGSAQIDILGGDHAWSDLYIGAAGYGAFSYGDGSLAGSGYGAVNGVNLRLGDGAELALPSLFVDARGVAGADGAGNQAVGGAVSLTVNGLAALTSDAIGIDATGQLAFEERSPADFNATPDAQGGTITVLADSGTITTPFLELSANGMTGAALTSAGSAMGGAVTVGAAAGGLIDIVGGVEGSGGITLEARGLGAEGPSAANATGGTATLYTAGGAISSVFGITVNADAAAGAFAGYSSGEGPTNGFNATGGTASVELRTGGSGGSIDAPSLTVTAQGLANQIGPVRGAGGLGQGGSATLDVAQGVLTTGPLLVTAGGYGGEAAENFAGGAAFAGGAGIGGTAALLVSGGAIEAAFVDVIAEGYGASAGSQSTSATAPLTGTGRGGTALLEATGGTIDAGSFLALQANGTGGSGYLPGSSSLGGAPVDGGDAFGGSATLAVGGTTALTVGSGVSVQANALGGTGGLAADGSYGAGGNATGGTAALSLADTGFVLPFTAIEAIGSGGFGSTLGTGTGGSADFTLSDTGTAAAGPRTIDTLILDASGYLANEDLSVAGTVSFTANAGSPAAGLTIINDLQLAAAGASGPAGNGVIGAIRGAPVTVGGSTFISTPRDATIAVTSGGSLDMAGDLDVRLGGSFTSSGAITAGGNAVVDAPGGISMTDLAVGGATLLQALGGSVVVASDLRSAGPVTVLGTSVSIASLGALSFADADATAGDLSIQTQGDLLLASVDATGAVRLASTAGSIRNTGPVTGTGITYLAAGDVVSDTAVTSAGALLVDAGGTFTAPGTVSAAGDVSLSADAGLTLTGVISGGATYLAAEAGALSIGSLTSPGLVTALGETVTITSPGPLSFASAQATGGNLDLTAAGDLSLAQGSAAGALALTSTGGSVSGNGPIVASGDVAVSASDSIALGTLTSGGTTALASANGAVTVTNLNSAGLVTATGTGFAIGSTGALAFADLAATAGDVAVETAGDLTLSNVDATGTVNLTSTGGSVAATGAVTSGGALLVAGDSGVALGSASSGGTTSLLSPNGAIAVTDLRSAGAVIARGQALAIASGGALQFADAVASVGDLAIETAGDLILSQATAAGDLALTSTGGSVASTGILAATGDVNVSGTSGIALATLTSGGTTALTSADGSVQVGALTSAGAVSASGRSVTIASPGALSFADARATAGDLSLTTAGDLTLAQGSASGALSLTSGGSVSGSGPISAGGNAAVSGSSGVSLTSLTSARTTALNSSGGAVTVTDLNSAGAVSANGTAVAIGSSGSLAFADLAAIAGDVTVQTAGNLAVGVVNAAGAVTLTSTGGALQAGGAITGESIALSSLATLTLTSDLATPGDLSLTSTSGSVAASGSLAAGGGLAVAGTSGVALGTASSGGTTSLSSASGNVGVAALTSAGAVSASGRSVTIASPGALSFADARATAGDLSLTTAGDLSLAQGSASGALSLTSGGSVSGSGPISAGGNVAVSGSSGVALSSLTSGGTTALESSGGAVAVTDLNSAGAISASGRTVGIGSSGSLTMSNAQATAGNLSLQAAQNLAVANASATGSATLAASGSLATTGQIDAAGVSLTGTSVSVAGTVRSTANLDVLAGQLFTLSGLATGQTVSVAASDVAIGANGRLGSRGLTRSITLRNLATGQPMNIGGAAQQGEFSLDKDEAARLFADQQITLTSRTTAGGGDVRVGDLALAFGEQANVGAGGVIKVDAGGRVAVTGAVNLTTVSAGDRFAIDPQRIDVIAGAGSIVMKSASGALQGILELEAGTIAVADQTTLDTIAGLSDFAAISAALGNPGAAGPDGGYLQAGTINLIAGQSVYIQNSGASAEFADRQGFRAGELTIETGSSAPSIAINGVIETPGGELAGLDTKQGVSVNGVLGSDLASGALVTINGCAAGANCNPPTVPEFAFTGESSDELEEILSNLEEQTATGPTGQLIQVERNQPLITPPLVDEPITGVGNDDLWQVKCTAGEDTGTCPAQEGTQ